MSPSPGPAGDQGGGVDCPEGVGVSLFGGESAEVVKAQTARTRADLERRRIELESQVQEQLREVERQRADLEAQARQMKADLEAQIGPMRAELEKMTEVAWTVDLYLGRDEQIEQVRDGALAPAESPIVVRQRVLAMSEEAAVLTVPGTAGLDYQDIGTFVTWLQDEQNLAQLLPEPKCIVVMVPTRVKSDSGNAFEDLAKDAANAESYWFIRNGGRVYLMTTNVRVGDRLLPAHDEFTRFFTARGPFRSSEPRLLEPGSQEWVEAEQRADARQRHFMRLMLVIQGLIDRTEVLRPTFPAGVNVMDVRSQRDGKVIVVNEVDNILTDGREPFRAWQKRLNGMLRPGHRVIGQWRATDRAHPRVRNPKDAQGLDPDVLHTIEDRRNGGLVIRFERTDEVWRHGVPVPDEPGYVYRGLMPTKPTRRASLTFSPDDAHVLPFDLVTLDELRYYLASREARTDFLHMVPVIKAAIAAKEAEAATETPFRDLIAATLAAQGAHDPEEAADESIHWWKTANAYGRPLNGDPAHEKKAAADIVRRHTEAADLANQGDRIVAAGRKIPGAICVARTGSGRWRVYADAHQADGIFLNVHHLRGDGTVTTVDECVSVPVRSATRLHIAWSDPAWDGWDFAANPRHYLTDAERADLVDQLLTSAAGRPLCVVEYHDPATPQVRAMAAYHWTPEADPEQMDVAPTYGALGWHNRENPVGMRQHLVVKTPDGVKLGDTPPGLAYGETMFTHSFESYSATYRGWSGLPWWPVDARNYHDVRPRLVWVDDDLFDAVTGWATRCHTAWEDEDTAKTTARAEYEATGYRHSVPIMRAIWERHLNTERARFLEDYGHDAEDLWQRRQPTIKDPTIHPRDLWGLCRIALDHDHPVTGQTLEQLTIFAATVGNKPAQGEWHHRGDISVEPYDDVIAPPPGQDDPSRHIGWDTIRRAEHRTDQPDQG